MVGLVRLSMAAVVYLLTVATRSMRQEVAAVLGLAVTERRCSATAAALAAMGFLPPEERPLGQRPQALEGFLRAAVEVALALVRRVGLALLLLVASVASALRMDLQHN